MLIFTSQYTILEVEKYNMNGGITVGLLWSMFVIIAFFFFVTTNLASEKAQKEKNLADLREHDRSVSGAISRFIDSVDLDYENELNKRLRDPKETDAIWEDLNRVAHKYPDFIASSKELTRLMNGERHSFEYIEGYSWDRERGAQEASNRFCAKCILLRERNLLPADYAAKSMLLPLNTGKSYYVGIDNYVNRYKENQPFPYTMGSTPYSIRSAVRGAFRGRIIDDVLDSLGVPKD